MAVIKTGSYNITIAQRNKDSVTFNVDGKTYSAKITKESFLQKIGLTRIRAGADARLEVRKKEIVIQTGKDYKTETHISELELAKATKPVIAAKPSGEKPSRTRTPTGINIKAMND